MDADTVQALRDAKALFDEGILSEQEFKEKKAELLQPKAAPAATKPKPKPEPATPPHCHSCGGTETPKWRCGMTLCNACGVRYRKGLPMDGV